MAPPSWLLHGPFVEERSPFGSPSKHARAHKPTMPSPGGPNLDFSGRGGALASVPAASPHISPRPRLGDGVRAQKGAQGDTAALPTWASPICRRENSGGFSTPTLPCEMPPWLMQPSVGSAPSRLPQAPPSAEALYEQARRSAVARPQLGHFGQFLPPRQQSWTPSVASGSSSTGPGPSTPTKLSSSSGVSSHWPSEMEFSRLGDGPHAVFLLPNVTESEEFMEFVLAGFPLERDQDRACAMRPTSVAVPSRGHHTKVFLQQLGPVDALEDVQRRARRVQTRRPSSGIRRGTLSHKFSPVTALPKVDDVAASSSTVLSYIVRPFESTKDAERQLGPILIIEASYQSPSHAFVPHRFVVALEEPGSFPGASNGQSGLGNRPLGPFGTGVSERLMRRGLELPVISLERRCLDGHRRLMADIAELLTGATLPSRGCSLTSSPGRGSRNLGGNAVAAMAPQLSAGSDRADGKSPAPSFVARGNVANATGSAVRHDVPKAVATGSPSDAGHPRVAWLPDREKPSWWLAERPVASAARGDTIRNSPASKEEAESAKAPVNISHVNGFSGSGEISDSAVVDSLSPDMKVDLCPETTAEENVQASADTVASPVWRWADAVASADSPTSESQIEGQAVSEAEPSVAEESVPNVTAEVQADDLENSEDAGSVEVGVGPPLIQVGNNSFCLPSPALAARRIAEMWRPGVEVVLITTNHYGTPLFCPNGDISNGLINLAPSGTSSSGQLVPLYWQNVDEKDEVTGDEPDDFLGREPDEQEPQLVMEARRASSRPGATTLPTHLEEDEEEAQETGW